MQKSALRVLQIAMFGEFLGHGIFALKAHPPFLALLTKAGGVSPALAPTLLQVIGGVDVVIAVLAIIRPARVVLLYGACWGLLTALSRPMAGMPIWDFVERWPNCGVPLALLLLRGWPKRPRDWFE
jgi:hypothetical protein